MLKLLINTIFLTCLGFLVLWPGPLGAQDLVINEVTALNTEGAVDEDQDYADWIELYNRGTAGINLLGYTITDDAAIPGKWTFPSVIVEPGGYLRIWASDKNRMDEEPLHTNFKLSSGGEYVGLYSPSGVVVDSVTYPIQRSDISYGRFPDGSGEFYFLKTPTPGAANIRDAMFFVSHPEGVYEENIEVALSTDNPQAEVYYTLGGDEPDWTSTRYSLPIQLDRSTVLRTIVYANGLTIVPVETRSYIVNENPQLPVLSLVVDNNDLWNPSTGIYTHPLQRGDAWERAAHIAFFEEGVTRFSVPTGVRIHGGKSRNHDKKNFRLNFRSEYGVDELKYHLFQQKDITSFNKIILYAPSSDQPTGNSFYTLLKDVINHSLFSGIGGYISAFRPAVLYLNGSFWGIYWIREFVNGDYIESNFGVTDFDLQRVQWGTSEPEIKEGDADFWNEFFNFVSSNDLSIEANYERVRDNYFNLESLTDYSIIQIFSGNKSWPHGNSDRFRRRSGDDTRWYKIMWDTDSSWLFWLVDAPMIEWATRPGLMTDINTQDRIEWMWSTVVLRKLLENQTYRRKFINRFADLLNTCLRTDSLLALIDRSAAMIRPEMKREENRWRPDFLVPGDDFDVNLNWLRYYAEKRPAPQRANIVSKFRLSGTSTLTFEQPEGSGYLIVNTLELNEFPWEGVYFNEVPLPLQAIPAMGYRFSHWSMDEGLQDAEIDYLTNGNESLSAVFIEEMRLSQIAVAQVTSCSAVIQWETSVPAAGWVEAGLNHDSTRLYAAGDVPAEEFACILDSLQAGMRYYYRIITLEADSFRTESSWRHFETLHANPIIEDVEIDSVGSDRALLRWWTDTLSTATVHYGPDSLTTLSMTENEQDHVHNVWLTGLSDSTRYYFSIRAFSQTGVQFAELDSTFTTLVDRTPPEILDISILSTSAHAVVIGWNTSEPASGQILYGLTDYCDTASAWDSALTVDHCDTLSNLSASTVYYFQIIADDARLNRAVSPQRTLETAPETGVAAEQTTTGIPNQFAVSRNYPSPFNSGTTCRVSIPAAGRLRAALYNLSGQEVVRICDKTVSRGVVPLHWNGNSADGSPASSGMYILVINLESNGLKPKQVTQRWVMIK